MAEHLVCSPQCWRPEYREIHRYHWGARAGERDRHARNVRKLSRLHPSSTLLASLAAFYDRLPQEGPSR